MVGNGAGLGGRRGWRVLLALASLLLAAGVVVRAIPPAPIVLPGDRPDDRPAIAEPMQLLSRGSITRVNELDRWIAPERKAAFKSAKHGVFDLVDCPLLLDWIEGLDGQRFERTLADLRGGTREEAFSSLVLTFELVRRTRWAPGLLARTEHAERAGGLLQDWLRAWGERAATDPLLAEPALAAALQYGRVMRIAWRAPVVGYNRAPYDRAVAFLTDLTGLPSGRRTSFGAALEVRFVRAATKMLTNDDVLQGLAEEAAVLFPDLTGECGE